MASIKLTRLFTSLLILVGWFGYSISSLALEDDSKQVISVEADSLIIDERKNISVYSGNVKLKQGSMEIFADELIILFNKAKELNLMQITGKPATFRQLDQDGQEVLGSADNIEYQQKKAELKLTGNATFTHAGDSIESSVIRINTKNNSIQAGNSDSGQGIKMLIQAPTE